MTQLGDKTFFKERKWIWYYSFDAETDTFIPKRFKPTKLKLLRGENFLFSEKIQVRPKHCAATKSNLLNSIDTAIIPKREWSWTQW